MESEIDYLYETDFMLSDEQTYSKWLINCAKKLGAKSVSIAFSFMDDEALHALNVKYLNHDSYTDIITFDDSVGKDVVANVAISIERVEHNAKTYSQSTEDELLRVMCHGLLHCLGLNDKTKDSQQEMRAAEDFCMKLFHVEHKTTNYVS